jgi:hypothetical protein
MDGTCADGLSPGRTAVRYAVRTAVSVVSHRWAARLFFLLNISRIANSWSHTGLHALQAERIDQRIVPTDDAM